MQLELLGNALPGERCAEILLQVLPNPFKIPLRFAGRGRGSLRQPRPSQPEQALHQGRRRIAGIAVATQFYEAMQEVAYRF